MFSAIRSIMVTIGIVLILTAVLVIGLVFQLPSMAQAGIERSLSQALDVPVRIGEVVLHPLTGSLEIRDVSVSNPSGFDKESAMEFHRIVVALETQTLLSENPTINEVLLEGGAINLAHKAGAGTNLQALTESASRHSGAAAQESVAGAGRKFRIKELRTKDAQVSVESNVLPLPPLSLNMANFSLDQVGSDEVLSTSEMVTLFLKSVLKEVVTVKGLLSPMLDAVKGEMEELIPFTEPLPEGERPATL